MVCLPKKKVMNLKSTRAKTCHCKKQCKNNLLIKNNEQVVFDYILLYDSIQHKCLTTFYYIFYDSIQLNWDVTRDSDDNIS